MRYFWTVVALMLLSAFLLSKGSDKEAFLVIPALAFGAMSISIFIQAGLHRPRPLIQIPRLITEAVIAPLTSLASYLVAILAIFSCVAILGDGHLGEDFSELKLVAVGIIIFLVNTLQLKSCSKYISELKPVRLSVGLLFVTLFALIIGDSSKKELMIVTILSSFASVAYASSNLSNNIWARLTAMTGFDFALSLILKASKYPVKVDQKIN
jgi:hypothetical protein